MTINHVAEPGPSWKALAPDLEMIHDLMGGTRRMRSAGLRWLPKEHSEAWEAWRVRLNRSVLFNGLARTVAALSGRPFSQDVTLKGAHPQIQQFCQNIDGRGCSITTFAGHLLRLMLRDGLVYLLVDAKPDGGMPYCVMIEASQMIGIRRNPTHQGFSQIRIREQVMQQKGSFTDEWEDQIRVIEPGKWMLFKANGNRRSEWACHDQGHMDIDQIPIVECAVNPDHMMLASPPLLDLAWLNMAHWQSSSDQRHILHIARVPILFARGMEASESQIDIGPNRLIIAEDSTADIKFVEHSGAAIAAGRQDLLDLEEKMAVMGLDLIARRPGQPTATARAIDRAQSNAFLHMLIDDVRDHLNGMLRYAALWFGLPEEAAGEVVLPKHFPIDAKTSDDAEQLLSDRKGGRISPEEFLASIEKKGVLAPAK
jgi:hypothetical protein